MSHNCKMTLGFNITCNQAVDEDPLPLGDNVDQPGHHFHELYISLLDTDYHHDLPILVT